MPMSFPQTTDRPRCRSLHESRQWQCALVAGKHDIHVSASSKASWKFADNTVQAVPGPDLPFPHVRIAVSGARKFQECHVPLAEPVLETLLRRHSSIVLIVGGAIGFDAWAARWGYNRTIRRQVHVHCVLPADHKQVDPDWQSYCDTWEQMPERSSYQDRNERMVDLADYSYAWPWLSWQEMGRFKGGTWRFIDYALEEDKMVHECITVLERVPTLVG
jgi:hypothetical protein